MSTATALGASKPRLYTGKGRATFAVRPASVSYTGDGTGYLGVHPRLGGNRLHWKVWTRRSAFARGPAWLNDCEPSRAEGRFTSVPATVKVGRARHGKFTRMTIRFRYRGRLVVDRRKLGRSAECSGCGPRYYFWVSL